jgi:hypothetical protein
LIVSDAVTFKTNRLPVDVATKICMAANEMMPSHRRKTKCKGSGHTVRTSLSQNGYGKRHHTKTKRDPPGKGKRSEGLSKGNRTDTEPIPNKKRTTPQGTKWVKPLRP